MSTAHKVCGLCHRMYANLKQHLNVSHSIPNQEEYALLVKYGNARTTDQLDCPICDIRSLVRLDKHVQLSHQIEEKPKRDEIVRQAKRLAIVKEFVALRNSNPWPPLVSTLGLDSDSEDEEFVDISDTPGTQECSTPIPVARDNMDEQSPRTRRTRSTRSDSPSPAPGTSQMSISPVTVAPSCANVMDNEPGPSNFTSPHGHQDGSTMSEPFNHPVEHGPSDGKDSNPARQCQCEALSKKVQVLERQLVKLTQQSTLKRRDVTKKASNCLWQRVIEDFKTFILGPRIVRNDIVNAQEAAGRCVHFCKYMQGGLPVTLTSTDLRFLARLDKLRKYPDYLKNNGYVPATITIIISSIDMLYKHIERFFLRLSKLNAYDIQRIRSELKRLRTEMYRTLIVKRRKVKASKSDMLDSAQELAFLKAAKKRIPQLFRTLETGAMRNDHSKLMGYIMGYLAMISGHRSVVLTSMLKEHASNADSWMDGKRFQILMDEHTKLRDFGKASFVLNATEFSWLKQLVQGKCCMHGRDCKTLFHTVLGGAITKPEKFLYLAWSDAGCKGPISFSRIRTTLVSKGLRTHATVDVALTGRRAVYNTRKVRLKALMQENKKGKASSSSDSSSEDEIPVCDDGPDSRSSPSSEELRVMRVTRTYAREEQHFSPCKDSSKGNSLTEIVTASSGQTMVTEIEAKSQVPGTSDSEPLLGTQEGHDNLAQNQVTEKQMSLSQDIVLLTEWWNEPSQIIQSNMAPESLLTETQEGQDGFEFQNEAPVKEMPVTEGLALDTESSLRSHEVTQSQGTSDSVAM